MRLIPYNKNVLTFTPFTRQMNRLFEDFFGEESAAVAEWVPAVDVKETDKEVVVRAEIPGIDPKEIEVSVQDNVLTLSGEKSFEEKTEKDNWHRVERRYGSFSRSIPLPVEVDTEKAAAKADKGVLTIHLAKKAEATRRKLDIQVK